MSIGEIKARFSAAVIDSDRESINSVLDKLLEQGVSVEEIVFSVIVPVLDSLAEKLRTGDITLAQHFVASQILGDTVEKFLGSFERQPESRNTIVLGTAFWRLSRSWEEDRWRLSHGKHLQGCRCGS